MKDRSLVKIAYFINLFTLFCATCYCGNSFQLVFNIFFNSTQDVEPNSKVIQNVIKMYLTLKDEIFLTYKKLIKWLSASLNTQVSLEIRYLCFCIAVPLS